MHHKLKKIHVMSRIISIQVEMNCMSRLELLEARQYSQNSLEAGQGHTCGLQTLESRVLSIRSARNATRSGHGFLA